MGVLLMSAHGHLSIKGPMSLSAGAAGSGECGKAVNSCVTPFCPARGPLGLPLIHWVCYSASIVHLCLDIQCVCLWFVLVHKFVAHCVYGTSPADSAVKLVCTTVTFIDVLHVFKTFLIIRHYFVCVYCPKLSRLRGLAKCLQYLLLLRACRVPYRMPSQHLSRSHEAKALADRNNNDDQLQWGSELFAASAPWVVFQLFC
jgi:hypothetical protein